MSKLSFEAFFKEVHGYSPFPWQSRLAARVTETGRWPRLLDLPTGVGKTSAIDVALYALAVNPERAPRRIVLVVDRRIIVDQAADHAEFILLALGQARKGPAREVADRLRRLWGAGAEQAPFQTAVLRGGLPRQSDWARRPDMPVVALSTVDQAGSRLLFRGYGVSTSMAPIHAGLLGEDALFLLDEVHLSEPFRETLASIESRWRPNVGLQSRFQVVEMSATPGRELPEADVLELEDEDRGHPVLEQRLGARKPTRFEAVKVTGRDESKKRATLARAAAEAAKELVEEGARTVGVVLNRVETARRTWAALQEEGRVDAVLLTGRMRPLDRDRLLDPKGKYWPRIRAGRKTRASGESLIVVATQTIEAGADLDFDGLVTECASLDALRQRFGRLDRRGEVAGDQMVNLDCAKGVVLVRSDQMADSEDDPVYGGALARTAGFLESLGDDLDFGLSSLSVPEGEALEALLAGRPRAPTLMPAYIDRWVQTSPPPQPSPELALFLHGTESPTPELSVVWRSEIDRLLQQRGEISQEKLTALLTACPPRAEEALALPLPAAKAWLGGSREADVSDAVGAGDGAGQAKDREDATAWVWTENGVQRYRLRDLYPGALVVLGVGQGGLTAENWDPSSEEPVTDLGDKAQFESVRRRGRGRATLRLWTETLSGFGAPDGFGSGFEVPADDDVDLSQAVVDWLGERMVHEGTSAFEQVTRTILDAESPKDLFHISFAEGDLVVLSLAGLGSEEGITEGEEGAFVGGFAVTLEQHSKDVRVQAESFVRNLGLGPKLAEDVILAAYLHDVGKADPRFQMLLAGGSEVRRALQEAPLAKSGLSARDQRQREVVRQRSGYPRGERHELLSAHMLETHPSALDGANDRDLVLHLVASHHGYSRPFTPVADESTIAEGAREARSVSLRLGEFHFDNVTTDHGAASVGAAGPERFWRLVRHYGPWGLAWLEALVRLADHRASEQEQKGNEP